MRPYRLYIYRTLYPTIEYIFFSSNSLLKGRVKEWMIELWRIFKGKEKIVSN